MADRTNSSSRLEKIADRKIVDLHEFKRAQHLAIAEIVERVLEDLEGGNGTAKAPATPATGTPAPDSPTSEIILLQTPLQERSQLPPDGAPEPDNV